MDVRRGHCWRCENVLLGNIVLRCRHCNMAEYCSETCRRRDAFRHVAVECQLFGPKKCSHCGKNGAVKECKLCNQTWYCDDLCQRKGWKTHANLCQAVVSSIKSLAMTFYPKFFNDKPSSVYNFYFGNTIVKDFLNLEDNEWSVEKANREPARDYHVLSAGCGDLRNTVLTASSLPAEYSGKLHITLDDFDPFIMARNVLFLYMLVRFADTEGIESSLTTIWYSLHIRKKEYYLITTSLDELIQMDALSLNDASKGLISVLDDDLLYISQVWKKWLSLQCQRDRTTFINLRKQREALFDGDMSHLAACTLNIKYYTPENKKQMKMWFENGLFLPAEAKQEDLPFDNPTLTGRKMHFNYTDQEISGDLDIKQPKDFAFVYSLMPVESPFGVWDGLRVKESQTRPSSSPMVMYHNYVASLLLKMKLIIIQGRLFIQVSLANCLDFPSHHLSLKLPNYDRIFTSNLVDYAGFAKILRTFKPLLNRRNTFSAIVTETMGWNQFVPRANLDNIQCTLEFKKCILQFLFDTRIEKFAPICDSSNLREYYNNTSCFLEYLRGNIMAGELVNNPFLQDVPSLSFVQTYCGLQMRDFRMERNRLVPFQYRENLVREHDHVRYTRVVEWCLPQ